MTRGRDSTSAGARSPRLAIMLRGLKILEHPKTRPQLWGVVVPWVRVYTMGQHGMVSYVRLHAADGMPMSPSGERLWPVSTLGAGHVISGMVKRARRNALRTGHFDIVDEERVTTSGRAGFTFLAAMCIGMFGVFGIYCPGLVLQGLGQSPFWIKAACVGLAVIMVIVAAVVFGGLACLWVRMGWFTAQGVRVTGEQIQITTQDGRVQTYLWPDVRKLSSQFVHFAVKTNDGQSFLVMPRRSLFVFQEMLRRQDPAAAERDTERSMIRKAFWWFQGGGIVIAAIVWWINAAGLGPLPHHPLAYYAVVGFVVPVLMAFSAMGPSVIARWDATRLRRSRSRDRTRGRESAPANPAG